jgi:hypothetical protein
MEPEEGIYLSVYMIRKDRKYENTVPVPVTISRIQTQDPYAAGYVDTQSTLYTLPVHTTHDTAGIS